MLLDLLNNKLLKPDEQHRVKLAFAEGYVAGTTNKPTSKTIRWFKVFQQFLTLVLIGVICGSLIGKINLIFIKIKVTGRMLWLDV